MLIFSKGRDVNAKGRKESMLFPILRADYVFSARSRAACNGGLWLPLSLITTTTISTASYRTDMQ